MSYRKKLNTCSGIFFLIGSCLYKLQHIPIPAVSFVLKMISLGFYLIGYILWGIAFRPTQLDLISHWSWIAHEHLHHMVAAITGFAATILCILSFINPLLLIIGLWIYVLSDIIWCVAEYKTWQDPARPLSLAQQAYVGYAVCLTLIAITMAITAFFPPTFLAIFVAAGISAGIGVIGAYFYSQSWQDNNDQNFESSYQQIGVDLGTEEKPSQDLEKKFCDTAPINYPPLYLNNPLKLEQPSKISIDPLTMNIS
jgi:hypothetical protein